MPRLLPPRPPIALAVVAILVCGWPAAARAQLPADARFSYDLAVVNAGGGETPVSGTLFYTPGTPLTVRVYFRQTEGTTEVIARDGGLTTIGVRLTYGAPSGTAGVITVASAENDIAINLGSGPTQFDSAGDSNPTRQVNADFAQFVPTNSSFTRGTLPGADSRVFLGSVTFQTPGDGAGTTTLRVSDVPGGFTDVFTVRGFEQGYDLDPRIDALSVAVAPVPEPAAGLAAAAAGLAALGALRRARRGRRQWFIAAKL
jgi:hypothetical protein